MAKAGIGPPAGFAEIKEKSEANSLPEGPLIAGRVGGLKSAIIHIVPGEDHTVHSSEGGNDHFTYGLACTQGHRTGMEDAHAVELDLDPATGTALFSVFDGHGGRQVADLCAANVVDAVRSSPAYRSGDLAEGLREAFFDLDARALACAEAHLAGATATVALVRGEQLAVAGVGDSRCVLSHAGTAQVLTNDHKPDDPKERARIQNAGGFVVWGRVNANLNISRALGDASFKQDKSLSAALQQVSPDPDVRCVTLTRHDTFMVLACDGLWNALPEQQVVAYVQRRLNLRHTLGAVAEGLVAEAMQPQRCAHDNVTVVVVQFNDAVKASRMTVSGGSSEALAGSSSNCNAAGAPATAAAAAPAGAAGNGSSAAGAVDGSPDNANNSSTAVPADASVGGGSGGGSSSGGISSGASGASAGGGGSSNGGGTEDVATPAVAPTASAEAAPA
ncbi:hypothetical protein Agub_g5547 [Astrephomene gubernaculifera]|uniref:protein-serine/threonine phosphatase n=1 Tax=Astrephomene gubernaculifera TaxID=47775 RepID=A0AAD3HKQ8_9CHLO|nr:hypothetical protein Agub_g5547 [Astrephomene gubernaculifera]